MDWDGAQDLDAAAEAGFVSQPSVGDVRDVGLISGSGRSPGGGLINPL